MSEPLPASLLQTAQGLIQAAERRGAEGAEEPLVPQLLERAIEQNPRLPTPYELLASYYIVQDEYDQAGAVIDRGEAAGIEEGEFRNVRAAVATEAGRIDEAFGLFEAVLADEAPSAQTVSQWANFFASRGHMDTAMRVVNAAAAEATDTEDAAAIRLLEVPLLFTAGRPGEALERFDALEAELAGEPVAAGELARARVLVAERLIADDATANRERIEQLLAGGEDDADSAAATKVLRARLALQQEEPEIDQAIALAQEALAADSTDVGAHLVLYRAALARGELSEALAHAREAAGLDPAGTAAQLALAEALMRNDRMNEAAQTLESLVAAQPGNPDALRMLTRAYVFTDRPGLATSTLARLEERNQGAGAIDLGDLRTLVAAHGTDRQAAEEALRGQLDSNPDDFTSLSELTRLLGEQGRVDEAQTLLDTYTAQYPDSPEVWAIAGQYYLQHESDDPTAASSAFQEALTLRPDYGPALKGLIEVQIRTRSVGTALGLANRYLQRQPGDPDILFLKARILSDNPNQREEAITAINQAIEADPRPEYYSLRGSLHLQAGNHQLALDDLRRFEQAVTGVDPRLSASLAEAYLGAGEPERALPYFREAEERANPNDTALLNRLAAMRAAFPAETTP
jgi:tetratricopeptide (TPR) repeat protein